MNSMSTDLKGSECKFGIGDARFDDAQSERSFKIENSCFSNGNVSFKQFSARESDRINSVPIPKPFR